MANAKKCDRCGDFYEEKISDVFNEASTALYRLTNAFSPFCADNAEGCRKIECVVDLCPNCSRSLKKWWSRKDDKDNG